MSSTKTLLRTGIAESAVRVTGGSGARLILDDGREVVDAMTTPAGLGHLHPRIVEAVTAAIRSAPTLDEGWATAEREAAAEALLGTAFAGEDWAAAVRFGVTGSEINDLALSLCQALTGRKPLVTRDRAYHGLVGLARSVTVQPQWHGGLAFRQGSVQAPPREDVRILPFPRSEFGSGVNMSRATVREAFAGANDKLDGAAAVIIDYTQGGCYANPAYQDEVAELAHDAGALWIADEVITGFGKSGGYWFNFQRGEARPDLVTMGKAMGGGTVPAAAVVLSRRVVDMLEDSSWQNYSALRSTDMAAAATRAMIGVVDEEGLVARADELHSRIEKRMRAIAESHPAVTRIDGRGLHWWVDLGTGDWHDWRGAAQETTPADRVAARALEEGALIATSGERDAVLTTFSLVVSDEDVDAALDALDAGLVEADRAVH